MMTEADASQLRDLTEHASRQALRAVDDVTSLMPLAAPTFYVNAGIQMFVRGAVFTIAMRGDSGALKPAEHPEVVALMRRYGHALQLFPNAEQMMKQIMDGLQLGPDYKVEGFIVDRRRRPS